MGGSSTTPLLFRTFSEKTPGISVSSQSQLFGLSSKEAHLVKVNQVSEIKRQLVNFAVSRQTFLIRVGLT